MNGKINGNLKTESGNILVVTLLVLFAISVIGATLAMVSSMDLKISGNQRTTTQSLFIAEAGLNEAIHRLSLSDPTNVTVGGWTGNAAIGDSEPYDPDWKTYVYLTSPALAPAAGGSIVSTGTLQDPNNDYLQYSQTTGTDAVLTIEHKWEDRDGDGARDVNEIVLYDPLKVPPENFASGYPIEIITVTGQSAGGERVIQAEVTKKMIIVRTLGALYVDKAVKITGQSAFCGHNHDINTPVLTKPNGCVAFHLPSGNLPGVTSTGDVVQTQGSVDIVGDPMPINDDAGNPFYSLAEVLGMSDSEAAEMLAGADHTSIANVMDGITYIQGDAMIMNDITGKGLLYITGNMQAAGDFTYRGLIYVEGDVHFTGGPWILGSMIVKGTSDFNFSSGNCAVLYSSEAITRNLSDMMPCIVLSWREM